VEPLRLAAYGVTLEIVVEDPAMLAEVEAILPPGATPGDPDAVQARFLLAADGTVVVDGEPGDRPRAPAEGAARLDSAIRLRLGRLATDYVFVHAGVVAHRDRAIVLPGRTLTGKTTLVAALVAAGAEYGSDEFAVLSADGLVHPYPKPLSLRRGPRWSAGSRVQDDVAVESLGGRAVSRPLPLGLVVVTRYKWHATWAPVRRTPAAGAMALFENAVPARERPAQSLAVVTRATESALVLEGPRGEAAQVAESLLEIA
jgi:hypothetical protein